MKIDMHCHTAEGSPDAHVTLDEVISRLKEKGFDGMLVTDHNSYKGYNSLDKKDLDGFVVLRGIEYDTKDAGHMLIVLPSNVDYEIFTLRGMKLEDTINIVHILGGVIGPAHPFDYYKMGMCNNPIWVGQFEMFKNLDFIESFNACGRLMSNRLAEKLADFLEKPKIGGSDSHRLGSIGLGYTVFKEKIENEDDLIRVIKEGRESILDSGGKIYNEAMINKHKILFGIGVRAYTLINMMISKYYERHTRPLKGVFELK